MKIESKLCAGVLLLPLPVLYESMHLPSAPDPPQPLTLDSLTTDQSNGQYCHVKCGSYKLTRRDLQSIGYQHVIYLRDTEIERSCQAVALLCLLHSCSALGTGPRYWVYLNPLNIPCAWLLATI
jgi:hypothetical protein